MRTLTAFSIALLALASATAGAAPAAFHASRVVDYSPGAGYTLFPDPSQSLGGPYGSPAGSLHVVTLGVQGRLTLGFEPGGAVTDGAGADLIVFENPVHGGAVVFAELVRVGVSTDGADYAWFPTRCTVAGPMAAYEYMDPAEVDGFAGSDLEALGERFEALSTDFNHPLASLDPMLEGSRSDCCAIQENGCIGWRRGDRERTPIGNENGLQLAGRLTRLENNGRPVGQVERSRNLKRVLASRELDVVGRRETRPFSIDGDLGAIYRARSDGQQTAKGLEHVANH